MWEKIKSYMQYFYALCILILGALFFSQKKRTEALESKLRTANRDSDISLVEAQKNEAKKVANDLDAEYDRKLIDYRKDQLP